VRTGVVRALRSVVPSCCLPLLVRRQDGPTKRARTGGRGRGRRKSKGPVMPILTGAAAVRTLIDALVSTCWYGPLELLTR